MKKTVLITAIGGDIAQGVATIVRESFPDWRLIGTDIHDRHGGSLFVDTVIRAPTAGAADYDAWLQQLITRESVDICIPMSEAELTHLARLPIAGIPRDRLLMANETAVDVGSDKLRTAQFLTSIGVPAPWTIPAEEFDASTPLPCMFKARRSAGSKAVFRCDSARAVEFYRDRYPFAVLQELLLPPDQEVTCAVFRTRAGATAVLQLLRTLVGGFTGWAQVIDDADVRAQCTQLADALDLRGAINVQLRITAGGPRIFEINPRFSSTALLRHRLGFQDVLWSIRDALGQAVTIHQPSAGMTAVRVQGVGIIAQ